MEIIEESALGDISDASQDKLAYNCGLESSVSLSLLVKETEDYSKKVLQYHKLQEGALFHILEKF